MAIDHEDHEDREEQTSTSVPFVVTCGVGIRYRVASVTRVGFPRSVATSQTSPPATRMTISSRMALAIIGRSNEGSGY